ncbi:MAG: hypothetical protein CYPHOPRED_000159 [Cyphobasidiales sp. Tagirdzhanova-0007]|nr:MAG: hypothetical protein CYPHOPRED_000159 [Cyphobasidiales sp. Tagirdzhanova-0007]
MSDNEEQPEQKQQGDEHINIKVVDAAHAETFFKIKMSTKLGKLMAAYADRNGQDRASVKFLYDGSRIGADDTPAKLEMEDNDSIDVVIEQVGRRPFMYPIPSERSSAQVRVGGRDRMLIAM